MIDEARLKEVELERDRLQHFIDCANTPLMADVLQAKLLAEEALAVVARERRRVPSDEGGPGKEEEYWMRAKMDAAIRHLRDVEDFYRLRGGLPQGFNQLRADRVRQLYEAITADFLHGKRGVPTTRERADKAEETLREIARRGCERYTTSEGCASNPALRFDAEFGADQVCIPCHARAYFAGTD